MIYWNDNAKAAVREFADYIGQSDKCERYLEAFVTKKTVADAVEYCKENGKICGYSFSQNKMLSFCKSNGTYCFVSEKSSAGSVETDDWQPICTREQFEAYVKEQDGEKWTHKYVKDNCYIKVSEPDLEGYIVVLTETDGYMTCQPEDLMPIKSIKSTLTKAEAWDKAVLAGNVSHITDNYDIT